MDIICSFCGLGPEEVGKMIAGPGVFICDGCGDIVAEILSIESEKSGILNVLWLEFSEKTVSQMLDEMGESGNLTVYQFLKNCRELQKVEISNREWRLKETDEELNKLQGRKKMIEDEITTTEKLKKQLLKKINPDQ